MLLSEWGVVCVCFGEGELWSRTRVVAEIRRVKGEEGWCQNGSLGGADAAEHNVVGTAFTLVR